ncbi:hypothetical protein L0Y59_02895 [Candidatus Uhrbacteria bacterium]|nr:hypothetical protein [Candidatus Uhrbacteria bacterium]
MATIPGMAVGQGVMFRRLSLTSLFVVAGALSILLVRIAPTYLTATSARWVSGWHVAIVGFVILGAASVALLRRMSHVAWEALLTAAAFLGVWYVSLLVGLPVGWAVATAAFLTLAHLFLRIVFLHDLFYLLGCVGVALNFALWLPSEVLLAALAAFLLYDMVAGPPGGPVVALATRLVRQGIVPGFILPSGMRGFGASVDDAIRSDAVLLGTGDLILPLLLVIRAAAWDAPSGAFVLAGLVAGSVALGLRKDLHPRAALLPLAFGAAVPFLIIYLLIRL